SRRVGEASGHREAEPGSAGAPAARGLETHERLEHGFALGLRNPGSAVVDRQNDGASVRLERDTGGPAVVERVVEQIRDDAPQREPVAEHDRAAGRRSLVELDRSAFGAPVTDHCAYDLV